MFNSLSPGSICWGVQSSNLISWSALTAWAISLTNEPLTKPTQLTSCSTYCPKFWISSNRLFHFCGSTVGIAGISNFWNASSSRAPALLPTPCPPWSAWPPGIAVPKGKDVPPFGRRIRGRIPTVEGGAGGAGLVEDQLLEVRDCDGLLGLAVPMLNGFVEGWCIHRDLGTSLLPKAIGTSPTSANWPSGVEQEDEVSPPKSLKAEVEKKPCWCPCCICIPNTQRELCLNV